MPYAHYIFFMAWIHRFMRKDLSCLTAVYKQTKLAFTYTAIWLKDGDLESLWHKAVNRDNKFVNIYTCLLSLQPAQSSIVTILYDIHIYICDVHIYSLLQQHIWAKCRLYLRECRGMPLASSHDHKTVYRSQANAVESISRQGTNTKTYGIWRTCKSNI